MLQTIILRSLLANHIRGGPRELLILGSVNIIVIDTALQNLYQMAFSHQLVHLLIYTDNALPGLSDQILACAPAQNFVHRAEIKREGVLLNIKRLNNKPKQSS